MSETNEPTDAAPSERDGKIRLGPLENFIGFNLRLAQDASFQTYAQRVGKPHLGPGRFAAMMLIHENPGITQMELSRAIARDKSSVTPLVQTLLREGLITRTPSETDRRRAHLRLTPAGEEVLASLLAHAEEHDRKLDDIVGDRKAELLDLLKKIVKNLT
ncbi:MarR family winged helix-turn-helix transcriptional regulator [Roseibium sp.]|uniref:MarR family winged helix-turn-helix transcriptional regulator n=1 Tax=Roseibium sp. TaxID=1936156 RepID=UPI003A979991